MASPIDDDAPDVMDSSAFDPPPPPPARRRSTLTSQASTTGTLNPDTCRICRSEGTAAEPLFHPCKCSGSIKFVHQECLIEWLGHSNKKHCELCKTPFRFTKLYDAHMPSTLPFGVFVKRAAWHIVKGLARVARLALVGLVWFGAIPWIVRWVWRWLFWVADAAWSREAFVDMMRKQSEGPQAGSGMDWVSKTFQKLFAPFNESAGALGEQTPLMVSWAQNMGLTNGNATADISAWSPDEPSMLSDWTYLSTMTDSKRMNRLILDVFEGQMITCIILTSFILVFLLREWVVQQQPLANLEGMNNVQNQLREAAERMQADNERLRRQQDLLDQARRRLVELQNEADAVMNHATDELAQFEGWESLEKRIDNTTRHLRQDGELEHDLFLSGAQTVMEQIRAAGTQGEDLDQFTDKVYQKFASYPDAERREWEGVLVGEIEKKAARRGGEAEMAGFGEEGTMRPAMPNRDFSSRATQIQRLLTEVDGVFPPGEGPGAHRTGPQHESMEAQASSSNTSTRSQSATSDSGSWEQITPPGENARPAASTSSASASRSQRHDADKLAGVQSPTERSESRAQVSSRFATMPVANAGPDARINIKQSPVISGNVKKAPVTPFRIEERMLAEDELKKNLEAEVSKEIEDEKKDDPQSSQAASPESGNDSSRHNDNPFHPDGPDPPPTSPGTLERRLSESFSGRVASAFREEFGLDEAEELENLRQMGVDADGETAHNDGNLEPAPLRRDEDPEPTMIEKLLDWFWGDIRPLGAQEPVPPAREEIQQAADEERREGEQGQEAPFVPVQNAQPAIAHHDHAHVDGQGEANDPEVVAAAQQAGLDADAIEDAEDLEGVFELIGVQGPIIGLFQTSAFCMLLVSCTIALAVFTPYIWGKVCLSLVANPVFFVIVMPLRIASFITDVAVDSVLMIVGWIVMIFALSMDWLLSVVKVFTPAPATGKIWEQLTQYSGTAAWKAAERLAKLVVKTASTNGGDEWNFAILEASVHAHASLKEIQGEVRSVLDFVGHAITNTVDTISSGTVLQNLATAAKSTPAVASELLAIAKTIPEKTKPIITFLVDLSRGHLNYTDPEIPMDPSLVYWSSTDRAYTIFAGYAALATLAAIYVAIDTPITSSPAGKKREKQVRDSLRQAGGVLKVILIISIEMLVFPLYCGLLLDLAFLPLFQGVSVSTRWQYAVAHPWSFCFVHWFVGTCYMFHFALFVGMCRKILRKGVLWFIRDPDDPNFHPVRDVLEKNVVTQLRKIAFSALVYGALVILCLGGVIWSIGKLFSGIFPIHWTSTEPVLEFPLDLLLYSFATPLVIKLFRPSKVVNAMYAWWLRRCARVLRLSHFLFDDRKKDEEGYVEGFDGWKRLLRLNTPTDPKDTTNAGAEAAPTFHKSGTYVLTPCNDSYRPPKPDEAFLHSDGTDVYIADRDGKRNDHFAKVYVPPYFRVRIALFMVCLWAFSAFIGLCGTLVPLVFGRAVFKEVIVGEGIWVNDIYCYLLGAYVLGGAGFAIFGGRWGFRVLRERVAGMEVRAAVKRVAKFTIRALRCAYVYGFLGLALPMLMALTLHFYIVLPLATWSSSLQAASSMSTNTTSANTILASSSPSANETTHWSLTPPDAFTPQPEAPATTRAVQSLGDHSLHILQEHALGVLYVRILSRLILTTPTSRAAEAFRRITANGYLDPDPRLATRYFIFPLSVLGTLLLAGPPLIAQTLLGVAQTLSSSSAAYVAEEATRTKIFRYSYAASALSGFGAWGARYVGKATKRWRAMIKDEVYLVGERLHNFGEARPPVGSRSVVRKGSR